MTASRGYCRFATPELYAIAEEGVVDDLAPAALRVWHSADFDSGPGAEEFMSEAAISLLVLAATVVLFLSSRLHVEWVAVCSALALHFTGVLTLGEALDGFGDPAVILIAALFVVSE